MDRRFPSTAGMSAMLQMKSGTFLQSGFSCADTHLYTCICCVPGLQKCSMCDRKFRKRIQAGHSPLEPLCQGILAMDSRFPSTAGMSAMLQMKGGAPRKRLLLRPE